MIDYTFMTSDHVTQIARLEESCFSMPWSENSIRSELSNPLSLWVVAVEGGCVAGYVGSQSVMGEADMMNLAVAPAYRRCGVGQRLVETLISHLKNREVSCLTLEVRGSNLPAISLYEKLGFMKVGCRPGYYWNPREDAWILRKEWQL